MMSLENFKMNKRGLIITIVGLVLMGVSLTVASSAIPSNVTEPNDLSIVTMFDEVTDELQIMLTCYCNVFRRSKKL